MPKRVLKALSIQWVSLRLLLETNSVSSTSEVGIVVISKSSSSGESFLRSMVFFNGEDGMQCVGPSLSLPTLPTPEAFFLFFGLGVSNGESSRCDDRRRSSSLDKDRM